MLFRSTLVALFAAASMAAPASNLVTSMTIKDEEWTIRDFKRVCHGDHDYHEGGSGHYEDDYNNKGGHKDDHKHGHDHDHDHHDHKGDHGKGGHKDHDKDGHKGGHKGGHNGVHYESDHNKDSYKGGHDHKKGDYHDKYDYKKGDYHDKHDNNKGDYHGKHKDKDNHRGQGHSYDRKHGKKPSSGYSLHRRVGDDKKKDHGDDTCHWTFTIETPHRGSVPCGYHSDRRTVVDGVKCGKHLVVSSTWSGQFGHGKGFTTLSVVDQEKKLIVWPAYRDEQLEHGKEVHPDQSYSPARLP